MRKHKLIINKEQILYFAVFLWSVTDLFAYSTFFGDYTFTKGAAYIFARVLLRVTCIAYILSSNYSVKEIAKSILIIMLAEITNKNATTRIFIPLLYTLAAGKKIDENKIIKTILISNIIVFVVTVISSLLGVLPLKIYFPNTGLFRYNLGFRSANTGPVVLFQISSALWMTSPNKKKCFVVCLLSFCINYFLCGSRTASILTLALLFIEVIWWITVNQQSNIFKSFTLKILYFIGISASLVIVISVGIATNWVDASSYNDLFSGRFMLMQRYFSYYKVTLFGQKIMFGTDAYQYGLSTLDNSYVHMLLAYGAVLFVLFFYYYLRTVKKAIKEQSSQKLITLILYTLYGFSETVGISFLYNYSLVYINEVVWHKEGLKKADEPAYSISNLDT